MIAAMNFFNSSRVLAAAMFLVIVLPLSAATRVWDLPVQPAADALMAFSNQSGYQVLFSSKELAGMQSRPVQGSHEPLDALRLLLAGSNFEAVPTGENRVVVRVRSLSLITGVVLNGPKKSVQAGAKVTLEELNLSAITGRNGRYRLTRIPAGTYTVVISAEGLQTVRIDGLVLEPGTSVEMKPVTLGLEATVREISGAVGVSDSSPLQLLEKMVVTPSRFGVSDDASLFEPEATLTHRQLETLPQLGEDLFRAIGRLPGLATTDYSAKFWVRGAPNEQVLTRLDGATLLEPYHMKDIDGVLSIIDLETVARVDLLSGGFTSEYGNRLGGVLNMETESHTRQEPHTTLGISLTGVRATNRGAFADGKGNWMVSTRMGYPDLGIKATGANTELKPRYYDVFAKMEYQLKPNQTIALDVLHSNDRLTLRNNGTQNSTGGSGNSSYGNDYVWARWRGAFGENLKGEAVLSFSELDWHRLDNDLTDDALPYDIRDDRRLKLLALRQDWSLLLTDKVLLRSGFEVQDGSAKYNYHQRRSVRFIRDGEIVVEPRLIERTLEPEGVAGGAYTSLRFLPTTRLTLESGLRFDRNDYGDAGGWSPRFNGALDLGKATIRAAWGRYRQEEGLHEIDVADGESKLHPAEQAEHRVLGLETRLGPAVNFRAEIYERITGNPRPHGENLINVGEAPNEILTDRRFLRPTHAEARGLELILGSRGQNKFNWSASYAWARTFETIDGRELPRVRDQRHTFYGDVSYHPNTHWEFTAAWQYHTGWPTTDVTYSTIKLNDGRVVVSRDYGPIYGARLPVYHRLDLRATRRFTLKNSTLRVYLDVFNAYNRKNASNYRSFASTSDGQVTTQRQVEQLFPLLPTLGIIWDF